MQSGQNPISYYQQALANGGDTPALDTLVADPNSVLQNFFQLPQYQLLFGQNSNQIDPTQRFRQDPGYQFAMDQGMQQWQRGMAGKGLLESGANAQGLINYAQGTADQNYQRWLGQQQQTFGNYQDRLQGLVNMGVANTGSQNALTTGQNQAGISTQGANAQLGTGSNISSLLANQGSLGASAYLNTGAAQSNNLFNAAGLQTQIDANNAASKAQSQNSLFSGLGQLAGSSFLKGGQF
jgi:hypothetical protein